MRTLQWSDVIKRSSSSSMIRRSRRSPDDIREEYDGIKTRLLNLLADRWVPHPGVLRALSDIYYPTDISKVLHAHPDVFTCGGSGRVQWWTANRNLPMPTMTMRQWMLKYEREVMAWSHGKP
jgi:hypothetical protein